jgi:microcystin-dependent protein
MASPFVGEIRLFAGSFAPEGWALCNGQSQTISANEALYSLIGTTYGGDGVSTFNLPDLRGRVPVNMGTGGGGTYVIGQMAGVESVTLTAQQMPGHSHPLYATSAGTQQASPANALPAPTNSSQAGTMLYGNGAASLTSLAPQTVTANPGAGLPHDNLQPYVAINFIIALYGLYPPKS